MDVLAWSAQEFHSITEWKLVRIGHKVDRFWAIELREQEWVDRLLRKVCIREVLCSRHHICVYFVNERSQEILKACIGLADVFVDSKTHHEKS